MREHRLFSHPVTAARRATRQRVAGGASQPYNEPADIFTHT